MRVTVLMENSTPSSRLAARHGLSLWLELDDGRRVLFDMGPNDGFLANARSLGVDVTEADLAVVSHGHYDHGGGFALFSTARRAHPTARSNGRLMERRDGALVPDRFLHEQSLIVREGDRLTLVSGCSHGGVLNLMDVAEELAGAPLTSVVAGFHLMDPSGGTVEDEGLTRSLARELAARPARYLTCHCTGTDAFALLRDELGGRVSYLHVGSRVTL